MLRGSDTSPAQRSIDEYRAAIARNGEPQDFSASEQLLRGLSFGCPEYAQELQRLAGFASTVNEVKCVFEYVVFSGDEALTGAVIARMEAKGIITENAALAVLSYLKETNWNYVTTQALFQRLISDWRSRITSIPGLQKYLKFSPAGAAEHLSISVA